MPINRVGFEFALIQDMNNAIIFKWLQRKFKFRNPESIMVPPQGLEISTCERNEILKYLEVLSENGIFWTYPSHIDYPLAFYKMKEPPLFIEYIGKPVWKQSSLISVVGSRKIHRLTQQWISTELTSFVEQARVSVVSGGAIGVDQASHLASLKAKLPTVVVLPSGLDQIYPTNLKQLKDEILFQGGCFLSEFEFNQQVRKNYFFLRNRLIAAFSEITLIVQATERSGTMLTVHHALEFGRPVLVVSSHAMIPEFSGNKKLIKEGALFIQDKDDLLEFWHAESWSGLVFKTTDSTGGAHLN